METAVLRPFADGEYRFWLPLPQIFAFERDHGPLLEFYGKLAPATGLDAEGDAHYLGPGGPGIDAVLAFLRLALTGGNQGMVDGQEIEVGPIKAKDLVADYCYPARPAEEAVTLAFLVAHAAVRGVRLKKKAETSDPAPTGSSKKDKSSPTAEASGSTGDTSA